MVNNENMKFVERFESSIAEFAILNKAARANNVTPDIVYNALPKGNLQIKKDVVTRSFDRLVQDGHLKKEGSNYTISDDGREDVQKLQSVVMDLPTLLQTGTVPGQKQGMPQTSGQMGGSTGNSYGNQGTPRTGGSMSGNMQGDQGSAQGQNPDRQDRR